MWKPEPTLTAIPSSISEIARCSLKSSHYHHSLDVSYSSTLHPNTYHGGSIAIVNSEKCVCAFMIIVYTSEYAQVTLF